MSGGLRFDRVAFGYGGAPLLHEVSFALPRGAFAALIGPNGAGKTTLLQLASCTLRPGAGRITLDGADLGALPPEARARRIALLPQALAVPLSYSVRELVALGRTPYLRPLGGEREADRVAVRRAMETTRTLELADRSTAAISGGERQRVLLAMALAQEPELLLLDEPTANLDIGHQITILELLRGLNRTAGLTVLAAIHDLNLASLYFDRLLVLDRGRLVADGPPEGVVTPELIRSVYRSDAAVVEHPVEPVPMVALLRPEPHRPC